LHDCVVDSTFKIDGAKVKAGLYCWQINSIEAQQNAAEVQDFESEVQCPK